MAKTSAATAAFVIAFAGLATGSSAHAAGFFEQLFGTAPSAPPAATYDYAFPPADPEMPVPAQRPRRVVEDAKPVLQKTTDLMHDKTLRAGDAVMMKTGIAVYSGGEGSRHTASQFIALDNARVSKSSRNVLLAIDETHRDPLGYVADATLKEGRSASANETTVAVGYRITDARGNSVRYVGP